MPFTIDIHTHILPEHIPDFKGMFGYGKFISLDHHKPCCARMLRDGEFFREVESNCWDAKTRMKECHQHGVDVQVLSTVPVMFSYWAKPQDGLTIAQFLNNHIAEIVALYPKRFVGLGTVPMQSVPLAIKELERCVKELGLTGVQIGTNINQKNLGDPEFFDFFAAASELGAAIFVHPWEMMGEADMKKYWLPWLVGMPAESARAISSLIFSGTLAKLPNLRVAFAHGGGSFPYTIGRIKHGFDCRPDLVALDNPISPETYLNKIYYDALVHDLPTLEYLVSQVGINQIALGSDYPFPLGENVPGTLIKNSNFTEQQKAQLLNKTALNWLNLPEHHFSF